jgi:hypothetical protein
MSGFLPPLRGTFRSRTVRHARYLSKRFRVNAWRKEETAQARDPMRARLRRLSRQAGWRAAMCSAQSQNSCNLPSHICVAICRNKSVSCPVMRRECAAGADLTAIDLTEVRDD